MFMKIKVVVRRDGIALGAPEGRTSEPEVTHAMAHFPVGHKKDVKKYVRSRNVYENKGSKDIIPE